MSKVQCNSRLLIGFALLRSDWLEKLAPLSQAIRSKSKTDHVLLARVFPRLALLHVFGSSSDWFTVLFASVVIGQSNYFGFTTLNN